MAPTVHAAADENQRLLQRLGGREDMFVGGCEKRKGRTPGGTRCSDAQTRPRSTQAGQSRRSPGEAGQHGQHGHEEDGRAEDGRHGEPPRPLVSLGAVDLSSVCGAPGTQHSTHKGPRCARARAEVRGKPRRVPFGEWTTQRRRSLNTPPGPGEMGAAPRARGDVARVAGRAHPRWRPSRSWPRTRRPPPLR